MAKLTEYGRMDRRVRFVKKVRGKNSFGEVVWTTEDVYECWAQILTQFLKEQRESVGTVLEDTVTLVIRYLQVSPIKNDMKVIVDDQEYDIVRINRDLGLKKYDTITIKAVK